MIFSQARVCSKGGISGISSFWHLWYQVPSKACGHIQGWRVGISMGWVCQMGYPPPDMEPGIQWVTVGKRAVRNIYTNSVGYLSVCTVKYFVHSIFRYIEDSLIISERSAINFRFWIRQWQLARTEVQPPLPVCGLSMKGKNRSKHSSWSPMKRKTENAGTCGTFTVFSKSILTCKFS